MTAAVERLVELLDVERLDRDLFRGVTHSPRRPVYGGQVLGQSLKAAGATVEGVHVHSLHGYFLRPGNPDKPIIYDVDRIRDGRSFATRRVVALQEGEAIFNMSASFQIAEKGATHQHAMPDVPAPEELPTNQERLQKFFDETGDPVAQVLLAHEWALEQRDADPYPLRDPKPHTGLHRVWIRTQAALPDDPLLHRCVIAYASDSDLLDSGLMQHGLSWFDPNLVCASLDHAIWFHRPARADEWLLYVAQSPSTSGGRGLNIGHMYSQTGELVATTVQEALMRQVDKRK